MDSLIRPGEFQLMVWATFMSPTRTTIAFRSFHRPARSFPASERAGTATERFPDHRMGGGAAPRRWRMRVPIKRLSVAVQRRQSRLTELRQLLARAVSTRIHGPKVRLHSD